MQFADPSKQGIEQMQPGLRRAARILITITLAAAGVARAQAPAAGAAPRLSGTVKASAAQSITVTNAAGQDVTVAIPEGAKLVQVAPGSKDLSSATPIVAADIVVGDKVLVTGTAGDTADSLHAARVVVMKSADIAQTHAAEEAAWRNGGGGLVKAVDTNTGAIMITSGARTVTISTSATTKFRRYSGDSVRFEDAVPSQVSSIRPGDQLRVRGTHSEDGSSIQADEIVTGAFRNFSGLLAAVDSTAGTVTLKDLATKKTVTVKVTPNSDLRRLPTEMAARFAARSVGAGTGTVPAGGAPGGATGTTPRGPGAPGGGAGAGARGAGADLSQMLSRLPTETLGDLKVGDAVMIVATQPPADNAQPTAVTLLAGVEPILQASPQGDMVLTPWSVGGGAPEAGGGR
jgi:co-chaperonin GroES (HSP10)